jgi:hypothetical protein
MDGQGKLVPAQVTNWFDNGAKDRWVDIVTTAKLSKWRRAGGYSKRLRLTANHAVSLNGSYQPAIAAKPGDLIVGFERRPSPVVLHLMRSSLLGDGCIVPNGTSFRFAECHQAAHEDYIQKVRMWLGAAGVESRARVSGFGTPMTDLSSKTYSFLASLREEWYPNGCKDVPNDLSWMNDFTVAKWYMDDGCLSHSAGQRDRALFATNGFSEGGARRLCARLSEMYAVDAVVQPQKGAWAIRVNAGRDDDIHRMWRAIARHVVPGMRYKLPERYRDAEYFEYPSGSEELVPVEERVLEVRLVEMTPQNFPSGRTGFDVSTTTGNYFAKGVLVHNSLTLLYEYDGRWRVNTRGSFAQGEICPGVGKTWEEGFYEGMEFPETIKNLYPEYTYVFEFCSPWNKVVRRYDKPTLFLLAAFHNESGFEVEQGMVDLCAAGLGVRRPDRFNLMGLDHAVRWANEVADDPTFEGFVLRDKGGMRLKVKNARYVALHRLKDNGNVFLEKNLVPLVLENEQEEVLVHFPEAADKVFEVTEKLAGAKARMNAVWECAKKFPTQKDFAMFVNKHTQLSALLFTARKTNQDPNAIFQESADSLVKKLF